MGRLLVALAIVAAFAGLAGCGGDAAVDDEATPSPVATVRRSPRPTPLRTPTPAPTPSPAPTPTPAPRVDLSLSAPRQGGFLVVRLLDPPPGAGAPVARVDGGSYPMLFEDGVWYRLIGIDIYAAVGDYPVEVADEAGVIAAAVASIGEGGFKFESFELPPSSIDLLQDQAAIEAERAAVADAYATFTPERYWSGPWLVPAEGTISDPFGTQRSINGGPYHAHTGVDIANAKGTPIVAPARGRVILARPLYLYGNSVIIDHGAGVVSSYNHMDSIAVAEGQMVERGQSIGNMGESGFVSGPHLHWEVAINGVRTDPMIWTQAAVEVS